jgi:hypothetical protein
MTPALGLTVYHPDKTAPGYTLFAPMTDTSAYLIAMGLGWEPMPADMVLRIQGGQPGTEHEGYIWCDYFRESTPNQRVLWERR